MNSTLVSAESIVPYLQTILKSFNLYCTILILVPGFFLNTLTFLIFLRKKFWTRTTMGFYYCTSTAISQATVLVGILVFLPAAFINDLQLLSEWSCKVFWFFRTQVIFASTTLDLALNTLYYNRFQFLKKYKNLAVITICIHVVIAVSDTAQWWRYVKSIPAMGLNGTSNYTLTCAIRDSCFATHKMLFSTQKKIKIIFCSLTHKKIFFKQND
jgi:hypothetical protein